MTFKDWDECLNFLEVLTKWPPVILYLAFLFRGAIARKLSGLEKIKVKETEIIFRALKELKNAAQEANPVLAQQLLLNVPVVAIAETVKVRGSDSGGKEEDTEKTEDKKNEDAVAVDIESVEIDKVLDSLEGDDREKTE